MDPDIVHPDFFRLLPQLPVEVETPQAYAQLLLQAGELTLCGRELTRGERQYLAVLQALANRYRERHTAGPALPEPPKAPKASQSFDDACTRAQLQKIVGASRKTVSEMLRRGEFPNAFRVTGRGDWRIPAGDVQAYLDRSRAKR